MHQILDQLKQKVLLCDGAHGTLLQQRKFDVKADFLGLENCYDILNQTRPDIITDIHRDYLMAGADCIETDTFSANKIVLADFNIVDKVYELNLTAAKLTRKIADEFSTDQNPRFVIGSMGPGTKLPSLDQGTYDEPLYSYSPPDLVFMQAMHVPVAPLKWQCPTSDPQSMHVCICFECFPHWLHSPGMSIFLMAILAIKT